MNMMILGKAPLPQSHSQLLAQPSIDVEVGSFRYSLRSVAGIVQFLMGDGVLALSSRVIQNS